MSIRKLSHNLGLSVLVLLLLGFIYFPVLWLVSASLSTRVELLALPIRWFPQHPTLKNYAGIFFPTDSSSEVARTIAVTLMNSFKVASIVTVICLVVGALAAYALVRISFRFNQTFLLGILGIRMIPEVSLVIPLFVIAASIQLTDTLFVLMITYLTFALPYAIWLMVAFFQTIPVDLEDAARIDGCSRLGILFRVIMPISTPGLVSTGLFVFLVAWDEFFYALIFNSSLAAKTVPVALAEFVGRYVTDINGMMAGGVVAALPPVILALIFQRYIVSGMTAGAVKG